MRRIATLPSLLAAVALSTGAAAAADAESVSPSFAKVRVAVSYPSEITPTAGDADQTVLPVVTIDEFPADAIVSETVDLSGGSEPRVLATLYGTPITEEDVLNELWERRGKETFEWMVGRDILQRELRRLRLSVTDMEVGDCFDAHLAVLRKAYPHLKRADALTRAAAGMPPDEYRERTVWVELALRKVMDATLELNDEDLRTYYASVQADFIRPERVLVSQVFVAPRSDAPGEEIPTEEDWRRAELQILEAHNRLRLGENFADVARAYGTGGQLSRWVKRGELLRELEDAAFAIRPGSITTPLRTSMGFHVLTVEEKEERNVPSFEEVREEVLARFREERFVRLAGEFMARLREKALESGGLVLADESLSGE
ncbi:MAG: peptidyl-prolyl cis-trans isomerase [Planctomycetaceae bacterium]|nr:peptidyl-prolyl cis-trans isomerase [Planctomycetaceae bacterium]